MCVCTLGGLGALALNVSVELVDDNDVVVSPISDEVSLDDDDDDDVCCYSKKQMSISIGNKRCVDVTCVPPKVVDGGALETIVVPVVATFVRVVPSGTLVVAPVAVVADESVDVDDGDDAVVVLCKLRL
jgi:hypothetical protein